MPAETLAQTLAREMARFTQNDGPQVTAIPQLTFYRCSTATEPLPCLYSLGLGIAAQGEKRVTLGDQVISYGPGQSLLTTLDLPVVSRVTQASAAAPFLGLLLTLDARALVQLASEMDLPPLPRQGATPAIARIPLAPELIDAVIRLIRLLGEPALLPQLAPLVQQEILVRLLRGPHGPQLRAMASTGTPSQQVARAVAWLKLHFRDEVRMDDLAASVHMSPSTFREHFRKLAGMGPLQYQKQLRLQEARQLMLNEALDAGSAAARVGYESATQFSREYSRLFGAPPQRDVRRLRELTVAGEGSLVP